MLWPSANEGCCRRYIPQGPADRFPVICPSDQRWPASGKALPGPLTELPYTAQHTGAHFQRLYCLTAFQPFAPQSVLARSRKPFAGQSHDSFLRLMDFESQTGFLDLEQVHFRIALLSLMRIFVSLCNDLIHNFTGGISNGKSFIR